LVENVLRRLCHLKHVRAILQQESDMDARRLEQVLQLLQFFDDPRLTDTMDTEAYVPMQQAVQDSAIERRIAPKPVRYDVFVFTTGASIRSRFLLIRSRISNWRVLI
jgi:hypothetical protein